MEKKKFLNFGILLFILFFGASAFANTPVVAVTYPNAAGLFLKGNIDVNFTFTDANTAQTMGYDGNVWISTGSRRYTHTIVGDANILDGNYGITCTGGAGSYSCGYAITSAAWITAGIGDGNFAIDINVMGFDKNSGTDASDNNFMVDNNKPLTRWNGDNNSWKNVAQTITLTCDDTNSGRYSVTSGCSSTQYRIDQNSTLGVSMGAWQTYSSAFTFSYDGNYAIDFNSTDIVGNIGDTNRRYVLIDTNTPADSVHATSSGQIDVQADINQTGIISSTVSTDLFIGKDQNFTFVVRNIYSSPVQASSWVDVNANFVDFNAADINNWHPMVNLGDGNYRLDYNVGTFDINFMPKFAKVRIRDQAGNVTSALTDINSSGQGIIVYSMSRPAQLDGNTTNFQTIVNFESIPNMVFGVSGFGKVQFSSDINLGTFAQAEKLRTTLSTAFSISNISGTSDKNILVDSVAFSDLNSRAKVTVYNITHDFNSIGLKRGDNNCGIYCGAIDYNWQIGSIDFNVGSWSNYETDTNAPIILTTTNSKSAENIAVSATTNEKATCRYSTSNISSYDLMPSGTTTTASTSHTWSASSSNQTVPFYIMCRDMVDLNSTQALTTYTIGTLGDTPTPSPGPGGGIGGGGGGVSTGKERIIHKTSDTKPTAEDIRNLLTSAGASENAIEKASAAVGKTTVSREVNVEKITSATGVVTYTTTVTFTVSNPNKTKVLERVKVLVEVPKTVAATAEDLNIPAGTKYRIVKDDPIIEYEIDSISAEGSSAVSYTVPKRITETVADSIPQAVVAEFAEAEAPVTPPEEQPPAEEPPAEQPPAGGQLPAGEPPAAPDYTLPAIIIIIIVVIVAAFAMKGSGKKKHKLSYK